MYKKEPWTVNDDQIKKPKAKKRGPEAEDLTGRTFGKLRVLKRVENEVRPDGRNFVRFLCQCECGNQTIVRADNLRSGNVISCGCSRGHHSKKHVSSKVVKNIGVTNALQPEINLQEIVKKEVTRRIAQEKLKKTSFKINLFGWNILFRKNR